MRLAAQARVARWRWNDLSPITSGVRRHERILERTLVGLLRAGRTEHVDERAEGGGDLPASWIVEVQPLYGRSPVLQHFDQLPGAQERFGVGLRTVGNP